MNDVNDLISRQAAIDALRVAYWDDNIQSAKDDPCIVDAMTDWAIRQVKALPPAQPDIIRCRNCKFASGDSRICMQFGHSPIGELDFCAWAERRTDE